VVSIWPHTNLTHAAVVLENHLEQQVCNTTLGMFDYRYAEYDVVKGWACRPLCKDLLENCTSIDNTQLITSSGLFFASTIEVKTVADTAHSVVAETQNILVPLESAYTFQFSYAYKLAKQKGSASFSNLFTTTEMHGQSGDTMTIILDHEGVQTKTYQDEHDITMSLSEAFSLVGYPELLGTPQQALGRNYLPGAYYRFLPVRITGAEILAHLQCYYRSDVPSKLAIGSWRGNVCTMRLQLGPPKWTGIVETYSFAGQLKKSKTHGISIKITTDTIIRTLDLLTIVSWLVDAVVLLGLLPKVFKYFVITCMGSLSQVYSAAINEEFNLSRNLSNLALHVMAANNNYASLSSFSPGDGISPRQITRALWASLQAFEEMDKEDVASFGLFCFSHMLGQDALNENTRAKLSDLIHGHEQFWGEPSNIQEMFSSPQYRLNQQEYLATSEATDKVPLAMAVKLFDRYRKLGLLEKFFTTPFFRRFYNSKRESSPCSSHCLSVVCGEDSESEHGQNYFSNAPSPTLLDRSDSHTQGQVSNARSRTDVDCGRADDQGKESAGMSLKDSDRKGESEVNVMVRIAAIEAHFDHRLLELKADMESKLESILLKFSSPQSNRLLDSRDNGAAACEQAQALQGDVNEIHSTSARSAQACQPETGEKEDAIMTSRIQELADRVVQLSEQMWQLEGRQIKFYDMAREIDKLKKAVQHLKLPTLQHHDNQQSFVTPKAASTGHQERAAQQDCLGTTQRNQAGDEFQDGEISDVDDFVKILWQSVQQPSGPQPKSRPTPTNVHETKK